MLNLVVFNIVEWRRIWNVRFPFWNIRKTGFRHLAIFLIKSHKLKTMVWVFKSCKSRHANGRRQCTKGVQGSSLINVTAIICSKTTKDPLIATYFKVLRRETDPRGSSIHASVSACTLCGNFRLSPPQPPTNAIQICSVAAITKWRFTTAFLSNIILSILFCSHIDAGACHVHNRLFHQGHSTLPLCTKHATTHHYTIYNNRLSAALINHFLLLNNTIHLQFIPCTYLSVYACIQSLFRVSLHTYKCWEIYSNYRYIKPLFICRKIYMFYLQRKLLHFKLRKRDTYITFPKWHTVLWKLLFIT